MNDDNNLLDKIDSIFVDYIRSQSFEDILQPKTIEHYDNVVMTTKQQLIHALRDTDVKKLYLIKNRLSEEQGIKRKLEPVYVLPYADLFENTQDDRKKIQYIDSMSVFYTRVYDLYNAIVAVLDPVYQFTNSHGSIIQFV